MEGRVGRGKGEVLERATPKAMANPIIAAKFPLKKRGEGKAKRGEERGEERGEGGTSRKVLKMLSVTNFKKTPKGRKERKKEEE